MVEYLENKKGHVRLAKQDDIPRLRTIYDYYVRKTVVSFEYNTPNVEEFRRRFNNFSKACPYLIYCEGDEILGYAYAHPAFEREAYSWCAESTIYVDKDSRGRGIGQRLYRPLLKLLKYQGYRVVYAVVSAKNKESCSFHEKLGFQLTALFKNAGYKFNHWLDVCWYEFHLIEVTNGIGKPIAFTKLPQKKIEKGLRFF